MTGLKGTGAGSKRTGAGSKGTGAGSKGTGAGSKGTDAGSKGTGAGSKGTGTGSKRTGAGSKRTSAAPQFQTVDRKKIKKNNTLRNQTALLPKTGCCLCHASPGHGGAGVVPIHESQKGTGP